MSNITTILARICAAFGPVYRPAPAKGRTTARRVRPQLEILEDRLAPANLLVTSPNSSGDGTLRAAIVELNKPANQGVNNTITFNIGGPINLTSALPWLT